MKVLSFPVKTRIVDAEGYPTPEFLAYMNNNFSLPMQHNLSDAGYRIPALSGAQIAPLVTPQNNFLMMGQADDNTLKVVLSGALKTIQVV